MLRQLLRTSIAVGILAFAAGPAHAANVPPGAKWTEATIPSSDGVELHADILRPEHLPGNAKTPVILSIGPYFNHAGQTGAVGPAEGTSYDPTGPPSGPNERFYDFVNGAKLMQRGYTFVMVDLRGFGGSNGCLDWGGPGEQADVVNAVKWLARRSWSNGNVGMYGKSYDGVTGLMGVNHRPAGLKAVVAQEPVYDLYRYLYGDGIRRLNSVATPALYDGIAGTPGPLRDKPAYTQSSLNDPACLGGNWAAQQDDDHASDYWKARNLIPGAKGSDVPLFLTQGLTENNTVADGLAQYMDNHTGYERAWLGPWEHVRGAERCPEDSDDPDCPAGLLKMGRHGFYEEVMRFYDRFLRGQAPSVADPAIAVQTNDGTWRGEPVWPPADARLFTSGLRGGAYEDSGQSFSTGEDESATSGVWTISPALPHDAHLAGSGRAVIDVETSAPDANLVVDVYDVDAKGAGALITRQGRLLRESGRVTLDLWSADWRIPAGHRIAVRITDTNLDWWLMTRPTFSTVTVKGGTVSLPFLRDRRTDTIEGDPGVQLRGYLEDTAELPPELIKESQSAGFAVPPALLERAASTSGGGQTAAAVRQARGVRARLRARRHGRLIVSGTAPSGTRLVVRLRHAGRTVRARHVRARGGRFVARFRVRRALRYGAIVTAKVDRRRVRVPVRPVRARPR